MIHGKLSKWQNKVIVNFKRTQKLDERKNGSVVNDSTVIIVMQSLNMTVVNTDSGGVRELNFHLPQQKINRYNQN